MKQLKNTWERLGLWLSVICAIHCIATPLLVVAMPFVGNGLSSQHQWIEFVLVGFGWFIAFFTLNADFKRHRQQLPLVMVMGSILLFVMGHFLENEILEPVFGIAVGMLMAGAFGVNLRHKTKCNCR